MSATEMANGESGSMHSWIPDAAVRQHGAALSRLFSSRVIRDLASSGRSDLAAQVLEETGVAQSLTSSCSLADCFDSLYSMLFRNYRSEYIYKNLIALRVLLGRHSLNTATMLMEFRAGDCKADCVIINGTSNVYEIKSEFDSMARIQRQLMAYRTVFDRVHVITTSNQVNAMAMEIDESVGLLVLNDRQHVTTVREPLSLKARVDPGVIFDSLRQHEYIAAIRERFGSVPEVPNTRSYQVCRDLFKQLSPTEAHDVMVHALKRRDSSLSFRRFVEAVPSSLKAASLACPLTERQQESFTRLLHSDAHGSLLRRSSYAVTGRDAPCTIPTFAENSTN